jgi:NAD(P)-dependent dehydrogenase (short-subunit alcohol dehydrogenase family)
MNMSTSITSDNIDLTGQVAIVTGGGRGIGRAIALALAKAGTDVAVAARSTDQLAETVALIEKTGGCGMSVPTDVTDQNAVERMVRKVAKRFGPVDLLVNNAGVGGPAGPMWEIDPDAWWQCMEVNLRGSYFCSRAVLPSMIARGQGRIVIVTSGAGNWGTPYNAAYCISKCALTRFSEILASETKDHAISVFSIHPGFVRTAIIEKVAASSSDVKWVKVLRKALARGRVVPPERAAELTLFLASGQADALSGCYFSIGDDVEEMVERAEEIQKNQLYTLRLKM